MNIKNLLAYCNHSYSVTTTQSMESQERTLAALSDPAIFILVALPTAINQLQLVDDSPFGAEESDLLLRQLRDLSRRLHKGARHNLKNEGRDVSTLPKQLRTEEIEDALVLFLKGAVDFRISTAKESLRCETESLESIELLLEAWTGKKDRKDVAVLAHFIWQIKRKLNHLPVGNHIMPVLYGKQAGGKSRAVGALVEPLNKLGFALFTSVSQLSDERYLKVLSQNYVLFADELTHADKTDVNALKNIITANVLTPRKLGTNSAFKVKQNCSFIGATNKPINELIFDATGMRRFYQINCLEKMDWEVINEIDYFELFKGINEARDEGYLTGEVLLEVRNVQNDLINKDDIESFIEDKNLEPADSSDGKFIANRDLYESYLRWAACTGLHFKMNLREFLKRLRNRGFKPGSKKTENETSRGFWISKNSLSDEPVISSKQGAYETVR